MSSTRRPPAGYYRGGLAGWAHDPTVGLLGPAGLCIHEDWLRYSGGGTQDYGEVGWTRGLVGGSGVTVLLNTPTAATEAGVLALRTSTTANRGGTLHTAGVVQVYEPPVGMVWATKLDLSTRTSGPGLACRRRPLAGCARQTRRSSSGAVLDGRPVARRV